MDFDFGRFGLPNIGNSGNIPPKKLNTNTEKTDNTVAPDKTIDITGSKDVAGIQGNNASVNSANFEYDKLFGIKFSAKPIPIADSKELQQLTKLTVGIDPERLERCMRNVNAEIHKRTGDAANEGMDLAIATGTKANMEYTMTNIILPSLDGKPVTTGFDLAQKLDEFNKQAYADLV